MKCTKLRYISLFATGTEIKMSAWNEIMITFFFHTEKVSNDRRHEMWIREGDNIAIENAK